jgi:hypothetical protein
MSLSITDIFIIKDSMYNIKCIECEINTEFRYKARFQKINVDLFKCSKCRKLKEKNCIICNTAFKTAGNGKTCKSACKMKLVALTISNGQYENISQIPDIKQKVSEKGRYFSKINVTGVNNPHYGYKHSAETKRKQRIRRLESLNEKRPCYPGYNKIACNRIDEYGQKYGYNFQHAENGGEYFIEHLGYFVDGYDKEKNTVIEYDEKHHFKNKKLREKDINRQKEIEEYLKCKFIRINELNYE